MKQRILLYDNVKALLIFLVVAGHFATCFTERSELMRSVFIIIYYFHMPLFCFISGLFSKSSLKKGAFRVDRVISYLLLYAALKALIFLEGLLFHKDAHFSPFYESGIAWYMLAMAVFLTLSYALQELKPSFLIPVAVCLSLVAGRYGGINDILCLSRLFYFYPFFLAGLYTDAEKLSAFTRKKEVRIASAVILLCFIVAAFLARDTLYALRPAITGRHPYVDFPNSASAPLLRLAAYLAGGVLSLAVISLLPNKKTPFSFIGAATLQIYFLHRPLLYLLTDSGLGERIFTLLPGDFGAALFLSLSLILTLLLSTKKLTPPFTAVMKLNCKSLYKEE